MTATAYDELPYDARPFPQSHPDRLATIATLFGMTPTPIGACRVLELGCAAGGNLIPMAEQLPTSEFLGVDLSARQILDGNEVIETLRLRNVQLRQQDLMEFDPACGAFDYIVCHGVYSWVPPAVQEKILEICARHLTPQGVAFISYNTYPGWRFRGAIRDMMIYHARDRGAAKAQVEQARALVDFLGHAVPANASAYGAVLHDEMRSVRAYTDSQLFHEYLEEANAPVYFHEFATHAMRHGLQYLGESEVSTMLTSHFPAPIADTLNRLATDVIRGEQYMDFLRNRTFRQTLLCRGEIALQRSLAPDRIAGLHVASAAKPGPSGSDRANTFEVPDGPTFTPGHPLVTAAFHHLAEIWRQCVSFDDLYAAACQRARWAGGEQGRQVLASDLLVGFMANAVELRTHPAEFVTVPTAKPVASGLARHQAGRAEAVTNRRHEAVILDDLASRVLSLLDGERDRSALVETLIAMGAGGTLRVEQGGAPLKNPEVLRNVLRPAVDQALATLAHCALLLA
jgi:methyltransferase-like protein/2-polyprenyl-3-methyl-5-hydroxy-6-metoxy-1,4-benzoquinol methylase